MQNRDKIALILAGGQIAHRREGSARERIPLKWEELKTFLPEELHEEISPQEWSFQPLSHYTLRMCSDLVQLAASQVKEGAKGVVVTCGTQALTELAYFADLVWSFPQPLVFTASIFNAGVPGSETALHLAQSVQAALSEACWGQGAIVCVQDALYAAADFIHFSNSSRSGFLSFPSGPLSTFSEPSGDLIPLRSPRRSKVLDVETVPARVIEIVDASLGGGDVILNALLDKRIEEVEGLVVAGFGNGEVPPSWVPLLRKILRTDIPVVLTSRCLAGCIQTYTDFEGSAAHLLEMGLLSGGGLSPLQARIRLALALGSGLKGKDLSDYMQDA